MAQQGQTMLPMTQATSAPQGGGPKAANPAAVTPLVEPQQQSGRPGEGDPRDGAVQEVAAEMQKRKAPPQPAIQQVGQEMVMPTPPAQPQTGGLAAPEQQMAPPMMAKGGMKDDAPEGLAVMIGLGAPTPSYEEAAEGNPPPGATKEEVADDQLVLLSEGELVVPANVVRYHGLGAYEGMRREALMGLQEMENSGQIEYVSGGKEKADPIDDDGGLVKAQRGLALASSTPVAASQQFVKTPTITGMMANAGTTTDTTPLTIDTDKKPFTPTFDSELKSIYAPNVGDYKKPPEDEEDEDDDDDTGDTSVDPCPPGYKMNPDTGVCEPVSAQRTARQDDPSDPPEQPAGATAVFGGTSQNGRLVGSTSYDFGLQSSKGSGFGILGALLGGSDQVVLTDRNTGRKAVMAKSTYEAMKADRTNPENNAFIQQLMDTQALIDADYARSRPDQGMFSDITGNKKKQYETTTAKSMAESIGLDYTGQSLAEIMIIEKAQSQTGSDATTATTTPTTGAVAPTAPAVSSGLMGPVTPEQVNYDILTLNNVFAGGEASPFVDRNAPKKAPVSLAQQMRALNLMQAGESGSFTRTDGTVESIAGMETVPPSTSIAINRKLQEVENELSKTTTADVRRKFAEGIDEEAAGFESGFYDDQRDARFAEAQRAAGEERERVMERARAGDFDDSFNPTPAERYRANKAVADAEARKQARDRGADEETARRTTAVTDSQGNPVRQGGDGPNAGTVVTSGPEKEDDSPKETGCCFIMLEARYGDGTMDDVVRRYRDEHMTARNKRGYYKLAEVFVPLMRKYPVFKWLVTKTFADPLVSYGKYYYGQNKHGVLFAPVKVFWMKVFDVLGADTEFVRENGEVI